MLFLAAMRDFPILSHSPAPNIGTQKPRVAGSIEESQSLLARLALDLDFDSTSIRALAASNPDIAAVIAFLQQSRPACEFEIDEDRTEALASYVATELQAIATPRSSRIEPVFSFDLDHLPTKFRASLRDNQSYQERQTVPFY